jgi:lipopolysaccharide transport system permease protein
MQSTYTTVISAERHERLRQFLKDLWDYRELFYTFFERDIKVRYKQTALGVIWVVLQPLIATGAYTLIFGKIAKMPTGGLPYILFYFAATVPWSAFAREVTGSAMSMESNAALISKVYFPRVLVPAAVVSGSFVDFSIGWGILNIVALRLGYWHWQLVALTPLLLIIQWGMGFGIGLVLAALNAQYRDVKATIGFLVQLMMLATPVIYPLAKLPSAIQSFAFLNPMAAVIETYRFCLTGGPFDWQLLLLSLLSAACYFCFGFWFFRTREAKLVDIL